jgi:hypothetical protein
MMTTGRANYLRQAVGLLLLLLILAASAFSQNLPDKIRGYKVYADTISVSTGDSGDKQNSDASVKIGDPELVEAGLAGITFELPAEVLAAKQSGKVDFFTFHEVKVNGISVEVEEYRTPFSFKKGAPTSLPKPARISLPVTGIVQAAWQEMRDSKSDWTVTGRVFVFGRFRKFGMYHKRVVPVDFEIKIKNPLRLN